MPSSGRAVVGPRGGDRPNGQDSLPGLHQDAAAPVGGVGASGVLEDLARHGIFRALAPGALQGLADRAVVRVVERGRVLVLEGSPRAGDVEPALYAVLSGWCKVVRHSSEGRETVLDLRGPGDLIGEEALALDGSFRPPPLPGAIALTACTVAAMPGGIVRETIRGSPRAREALLAHLAGRILEAQLRLADRALPVPSRLISLLRWVTEGRAPGGGDACQRPDPAWVRVPPLAQHDLALLIGASRETVNRALSGLAASGLVMLVRGQPVAVRGGSSTASDAEACW